MRAWLLVGALLLSGCLSAMQIRADKECVDLAAKYRHGGAICIGNIPKHWCTCAEPKWDSEFQSSLRLGPVVDFDACLALHDTGEL